jgi:hypothetical protein
VCVTNIEPGLTRTELGGHIDNVELSAQLDATFEAVPAPPTCEDIADLIVYATSRHMGPFPHTTATVSHRAEPRSDTTSCAARLLKIQGPQLP